LNSSTYATLPPFRQSISIEGTLLRAERITFIPSQTEISRSQFIALPTEILPINDTPQVVQTKRAWSLGKKSTLVKHYAYTQETSPLQFRNYLTLSTNENFENQFHIDTHFWVTEVQEMRLR
jgi:hypothetical protein